MTTKEQERKALEQIRKIVEGLGENSYIGTAFEGCFEIAEENIKNDFACSMKQRWEAAEEACDRRREQVSKLEKMNDELKAKNAKVDEIAKKLNESIELNDSIAHKLEDMRAERNAASETSVQYWNKLQEAETKLDEKEDEIVRLKAKLYDLLIKTA